MHSNLSNNSDLIRKQREYQIQMEMMNQNAPESMPEINANLM